MSRIAELGAALASAINDAPSGTFSVVMPTALFQYEADYTIPDGETMRVVVVPASARKERSARSGMWTWTYVFHVGVLGDVSATGSTGIDSDLMAACLGVVEDLSAWLQDKRYGATSNAALSEPIVNEPPYDPVDLDERKFVSVLEATLRADIKNGA